MRKMTMAITSMMEATREFNSKVDFISMLLTRLLDKWLILERDCFSCRKIIDFRKLLYDKKKSDGLV